MSEYELQQLLIASRWEFDIPTLLFMALSLVFIVPALLQASRLERLTVLLCQLSYLLAAGFLWLRTHAAIIRGQKLGGLIAGQQAEFEFWNPAFQQPTWYLRIGVFLAFGALTLYLLQRASRSPDGKAGP